MKYWILGTLGLLAAATGVTTKQLRTAAPSAVNLSSVAADEGTSLSVARADHTHPLSGTLPQASGGTGAGALTCTTGQGLTSNGTVYSCTTLVAAPDFTTTSGRTGLAFVSGTADTTLTAFGMGSITAVAGANIAYSSDSATDTSRNMVKGAVTATSTAASWSNVTTSRRNYLPKMTVKVYVPSLGTANGQDRVILGGFQSAAPTATGTGSFCAAQSTTLTGAWICYANWTSLPSGVNWLYVRGDGANTLNADSGIPVTVGIHTLVIDYTTAGQVTMSVDGAGAATSSTGLGTATTTFGPVLYCGTWSVLAAYSCSTPGFQVTQTF